MEALKKINEANKLLYEAKWDLQKNHSLTISWEIKLNHHTDPFTPEIRKAIEEDEEHQKLLQEARNRKCAEAAPQSQAHS
jgi:hypothetical protein